MNYPGNLSWKFLYPLDAAWLLRFVTSMTLTGRVYSRGQARSYGAANSGL
jgi:hypothetical protein